MKRKLYSNMKRMTMLFSIAIICVTLTALTLRLTVLGDLSNSPTGGRAAQVESERFDFVIARRVNFSSPEARGNFRIENLETNEYYMRVSIIMPDTGQEVFYSGFVRPGERHGAHPLHIQLPSGTHESIARVTAYDPLTFEPRGSEEQSITLHIG
ncbi:MAG: hypothetical protein FWE19_07385 [Oscillospiraceae bacterium]|nr:hypothetical protein [Oscillospiraceae bacterium]